MKETDNIVCGHDESFANDSLERNESVNSFTNDSFLKKSIRQVIEDFVIFANRI